MANQVKRAGTTPTGHQSTRNSLSLSLDLLTYLPTFLPTDYLPPYSFTQSIDRNIHIGIDIDMHEAHAHMSTTTTNKIDFRRGSHCPSDCPGKVA